MTAEVKLLTNKDKNYKNRFYQAEKHLDEVERSTLLYCAVREKREFRNTWYTDDKKRKHQPYHENRSEVLKC